MIFNRNETYNALILGTLIFLWSCGGSGSSETSTNTQNDEFESAQAEVSEQIDRVVHELPPPSEVPLLLQQVGADFNSAVANDVSKVKSYQTNEKAALNLGIYATDVGYFASYEQVQDALKYMERSSHDHLPVLTVKVASRGSSARLTSETFPVCR